MKGLEEQVCSIFCIPAEVLKYFWFISKNSFLAHTACIKMRGLSGCCANGLTNEELLL